MAFISKKQMLLATAQPTEETVKIAIPQPAFHRICWQGLNGAGKLAVYRGGVKIAMSQPELHCTCQQEINVVGTGAAHRGDSEDCHSPACITLHLSARTESC